jgi:hypothetical protein
VIRIRISPKIEKNMKAATNAGFLNLFCGTKKKERQSPGGNLPSLKPNLPMSNRTRMV